MDDERRQILDEVAAGRMSPADAAVRLRDGLGGRDARSDDGFAAPGGDPAVRLLRVECRFGAVRIVADPTVATAVADGPHEVHSDGSTLTISDRVEGRGFTFHAGKGGVGIGPRGGRLEIRANPGLDLAVEQKAGELEVLGMQSHVSASVTAGTLRLDRFEGPLDLRVKAGAVEGSGRLTQGSSSIQCTLCEIRLDLAPDSNVTVTARARLGDVRLPDSSAGGLDIGERRYVFGDGDGTLDIETTAGAVDIRRAP